MRRLQINDAGLHTDIKPSIGDIGTFSIKPRWWVRAMSAAADGLWHCHLTAASWAMADLCLWLQKKIRSKTA